jgi:hypothetical protein
MDMNHDLIAAGHPRLNFEYASYLASYPKHWRERHEKAPDAQKAAKFERESWAVGQVVTLQAALRLLADRADAAKSGQRIAPAPPAVWPEFSESECFACHHTLTKPDARIDAAHIQGRPGRLPWGTWPKAMLPDLAGATTAAPGVSLADLEKKMAELVPDESQVADLARKAVASLDGLLDAMKAEPFDDAWAGRVGQALRPIPSADKPGRERLVREGWDRLAQEYLARSALARAAGTQGADDSALRSFFTLLEFPLEPTRFDSPHIVPEPAGPGPGR